MCVGRVLRLHLGFQLLGPSVLARYDPSLALRTGPPTHMGMMKRPCGRMAEGARVKAEPGTTKKKSSSRSGRYKVGARVGKKDPRLTFRQSESLKAELAAVKAECDKTCKALKASEDREASLVAELKASREEVIQVRRQLAEAHELCERAATNRHLSAEVAGMHAAPRHIRQAHRDLLR